MAPGTRVMVGNASSGILIEVFTIAVIVLGSTINGANVCDRSLRKVLLVRLVPNVSPPSPVRERG